MRRLSSLLAIAMLAAGAPCVHAQSLLSVEHIYSFQMLKGGPQSSASAQLRLQGTSFVLQPDRGIVINCPLGSDVYPLSGRYQQNGAVIKFHVAGRSRGRSAGTAYVIWNGTIDLVSGSADIDVSSGMSDTADDPRVTGGTSEHYHATLGLR